MVGDILPRLQSRFYQHHHTASFLNHFNFTAYTVNRVLCTVASIIPWVHCINFPAFIENGVIQNQLLSRDGLHLSFQGTRYVAHVIRDRVLYTMRTKVVSGVKTRHEPTTKSADNNQASRQNQPTTKSVNNNQASRQNQPTTKSVDNNQSTRQNQPTTKSVDNNQSTRQNQRTTKSVDNNQATRLNQPTTKSVDNNQSTRQTEPTYNQVSC